VAVLSLLFSDMVFSSGLILDRLWNWLCFFVLPGTTVVTPLCEHGHYMYPVVNMTCGNDTMVATKVLVQMPLIISKIWYQLYFTSSLASASWSLILSIAIYVTTHVKWVSGEEKEKKLFSSNVEDMITTNLNDTAADDPHMNFHERKPKNSNRKLCQISFYFAFWIVTVLFFLFNSLFSIIWFMNNDTSMDSVAASAIHFVYVCIYTLVS